MAQKPGETGDGQNKKETEAQKPNKEIHKEKETGVTKPDDLEDVNEEIEVGAQKPNDSNKEIKLVETWKRVKSGE